MIKKTIRTLLVLVAAVLAGYSSQLHAEDIDVYVDLSGTAAAPNVLFLIDNSSNLAATWGGGGCSGYGDGSGAPSLGTGTAGGIVQCALVDALASLPDNAMNIGIMAGNARNFGTDKGCVGGDGGCLLWPLTPMDRANKKALSDFVKSWVKENSGKSGEYPFTVQSVGTAGIMQEAWAYFNAGTGASTRPYTKNWLKFGCQKNFAIFIGNTDKSTVNTDVADSGMLQAARTYMGASDAAKWGYLDKKITTPDPVKFENSSGVAASICGSPGVTSVPVGSNSNDWSTNWADEWARLMQNVDGGTSDMEGVQNVTTYTIGIVDNTSNTCRQNAGTPALLQSMANYGGGTAFRVSNAAEIADALARTLNDVQAVNSVFSSASLPVSVNAEGSYLNQIFLGMFRPDGSGAPRWLGNLKQYQLVRIDGNLVMGDATGQRAISKAGTGFLSTTAISFWTEKDTGKLPDSLGGFFVNDPKGSNLDGTSPNPYDSPDGEVVEKGGVSQKLRLDNLASTFSGASGATGNPRRMFTYCPSGSSCQSLLTDATNDFSDANNGISSTVFGSSVSVGLKSVRRDTPSGTTATVTTNTVHGMPVGSTQTVTVTGVSPNVFNVTQSVSVTGTNTFKITGIPVDPPVTNSGTFTIAAAGPALNITSIRRSAGSSGPTETATATTAVAHGFIGPTAVILSNISATTPEFQFSGTATPVSATTFSYPVTISPPVTNANVYQMAFAPTTATVVDLSTSGGVVTVGYMGHPYFTGQTIVIANNATAACNGIFTVTSTTNKVFTFNAPSGVTCTTPNGKSNTTTVTVDTTAVTIAAGTLSRVTAAAGGGTATISGLSSTDLNRFGKGAGVKPAGINITKLSGTAGDEANYLATGTTVTCTGSVCTYPIATTAIDALATANSTMQVASQNPTLTQTLNAGQINRDASGNVTVTGLVASRFVGTTSATIAPVSAPTNESAFSGQYTVSCVDATCTTMKYGPVALTPQAGNGGVVFVPVSGDRNAMIRWVRGEDSQGDEKGPDPTHTRVTVRPSIHGDVLHSRPLVINYGDTRRGIVVYYGANDGVFRAVNGNQKTEVTLPNGVKVPAGGELWGMVLPEHFSKLTRLRYNSPEVKFPTTFLASALPRDYFVDGPTGVYQKLNTNGSINRAIIYLTMRRGGEFLYAIDVTEPSAPRYLWSKDRTSAGFGELGQTWSRPRLTLLQNRSGPVLVFGAGYDTSQDAQPPAEADNRGRGIFIIDAESGALVWSASPNCTASSTCAKVPAMQFSIPSDVTFVDRDGNGKTDKVYFGDLGGNVWRVDVADPSTSKWTVTRIAALGCDTGAPTPATMCGTDVDVKVDGSTSSTSKSRAPRKIFFPPSVLTVGKAGDPSSYEAVSVVTGDREHPLKITSTGSSYNVLDRFFMIKDKGTTVSLADADGNVAAPTTTVDVRLSDLFNANPYDATINASTGQPNGYVPRTYTDSATSKGFFYTFATGEKAVNAPQAVNGLIFFATNRPIDSDKMCRSNLGEAKAYATSPFTASVASNVLDGGGLPPSAVSGLVQIENSDGSSTLEKFCIGCGLPNDKTGGNNGTTCNSALENCNVGGDVQKNLRRTYWYKK